MSQPGEEEEEEDFMSDKFLKPTPEPAREGSTKTYSELRKRKLLEATARSHKRSRAEREIEAREEGLGRNLIDEHLTQQPGDQPATHSKAVQMMLKMGFQPGTSLGAAAATEAKGPIDIAPRAGRSGIGILPSSSASKRPRLRFGSAAKSALTPEESAQRDAFLAMSRARFDGRKVDAILARACRTCEELDRRRSIESNVLWLGPYQEEEPSPTILEQLASASDHELENTEEQAWLALDSSTRLSYVLEYLREEYFYCLWCGCQYGSSEELATECPGEEEDDH